MLEFRESDHSYWWNGVKFPSTTQILSSENFINADWFTDWSRDKGRLVHLVCHLDDTNELDESTVDTLLQPYLDAYRAFKRDTGFIVESSEIPLVSEAYCFAGTPDKVGKLNSSNALIDLKSGAVEPWAALQLSFYEILTNHPHKRFALQLTAEGKYKLIPFVGRQDRNLCLSILSIYFWKKNNLKERKYHGSI
jgi:hypothetical protein